MTYFVKDHTDGLNDRLRKVNRLLKGLWVREGRKAQGDDGKVYSIFINDDKETLVTIGEGKGFCDFCCDFHFYSNGKFMEHGVWE